MNMKNKTLLLASLSLWLLAGSLLAQPPDRPPQQKPSPMRMLDLTEEQQAKIQTLRLQLEKDLLPFRSKLPALGADLRAATTAEKFDESKVRAIVEQMQKLHTEMQMKEILHGQAVRSLLTPAQREKFDLHILAGHGPGRPEPPDAAPPMGAKPPLPPREPN
jgi:Spy/CpxP family protein refolding chaperone